MRRFFKRFLSRVSKHADDASLANEAEPLSPLQKVPDLCSQLAERLAVEIEGINVDVVTDGMRSKLVTTGVVHANVEFIFRTRTAHINHVQVEAQYRGNQLCRRFTQALYEVVDNFGFEQITLRAVLDGRIAWAAMGFIPVTHSWPIVKLGLNAWLNEFEELFPGEMQKYILSMIDNNDRHVLPLIVNYKYNLSDDDKKTLFYNMSSKVGDWDGALVIGNEIHKKYLFRPEA